ncbi:MAG: hypothetical protein ACXQT5_07960 [Candidatus Syntropharchaeia archaeon]
MKFSPRTLSIENKITRLNEEEGIISFFNCPLLRAMKRMGTEPTCKPMEVVLNTYVKEINPDFEGRIELKSGNPCCEWRVRKESKNLNNLPRIIAHGRESHEGSQTGQGSREHGSRRERAEADKCGEST